MGCVNIVLWSFLEKLRAISGKIKIVDVSIYFWRCSKKLSRREFTALVLAVYCSTTQWVENRNRMYFFPDIFSKLSIFYRLNPEKLARFLKYEKRNATS